MNPFFLFLIVAVLAAVSSALDTGRRSGRRRSQARADDDTKFPLRELAEYYRLGWILDLALLLLFVGCLAVVWFAVQYSLTRMAAVMASH